MKLIRKFIVVSFMQAKRRVVEDILYDESFKNKKYEKIKIKWCINQEKGPWFPLDELYLLFFTLRLKNKISRVNLGDNKVALYSRLINSYYPQDTITVLKLSRVHLGDNKLTLYSRLLDSYYYSIIRNAYSQFHTKQRILFYPRRLRLRLRLYLYRKHIG